MALLPITKKPWPLISLMFVVFTIITTFCGLAIWLILNQKSEGFQPLEKASLVSTSEFNKIIESGVRPDKKVSLDYLRTKTTTTEFKSNGESYRVFRVAAPKNCGGLGCLHIIKPANGAPINLQLYDIDPTVSMFKPSMKPKCFLVVQPGEVYGYREFETCEKPL